MHGPINVKSPNNISEWQMGFNWAFKGLNVLNQILKVMQLSFPKCKFLASFYAFSHDRLKQGGLCHEINEYTRNIFCHFYTHPMPEGKITAQDLFLNDQQ
jgi:hypothetical protein